MALRARLLAAAGAAALGLAVAGAACGGSGNPSSLENKLNKEITTVPGAPPAGLGPAFGGTSTPGVTSGLNPPPRAGTGIDGGANPGVTAATAPPLTGPVATEPTTTLPSGADTSGYITVDATASGDPYAALQDLQSLGLVNGAVAGRIVSGRLPAGALAAARRLPSVQIVQQSGSTTN